MRIRIGSKEFERLLHISRYDNYILVPDERSSEYNSLERKGLITKTPARTHKTLKSQFQVVDVWRIELTPLSLMVVRASQSNDCIIEEA